MKRVEIITNNAIAEDLLEALENQGIGQYYTFLPQVHGRGSKGTRAGSALWPEENCIYLLYIEDRLVTGLKEAMKEIKLRFPKEGTKYFISQVEQG